VLKALLKEDGVSIAIGQASYGTRESPAVKIGIISIFAESTNIVMENG